LAGPQVSHGGARTQLVDHLVTEHSQVWCLDGEHGTQAPLTASLQQTQDGMQQTQDGMQQTQDGMQQTQDGMQAALWAPQHT
jgi:hypothetical protein